MCRIARMFYEEGLSQAQIASKVRLSRPQVSRCLSRAKETGMVEIRIREPLSKADSALGRELADRLGLREVRVAPLVRSREAGEDAVRDAIASTAADHLVGLFSASRTVGVGWGRTLHRTILSLPGSALPSDLTFVPLIGGLGQSAPHYQVNNLVDRLAEKLKARSVFLNVPAFTDSRALYRQTVRSGGYASILEHWSRLDMAVVGLGEPVSDSEVLREEMAPSMVRRLAQSGAVGDILGQFFDGEGALCPCGMEERLVGFGIGKLAKIRTVVCLSGGTRKIDGIAAAAKAGYFHVLVTDRLTAEGIRDGLGRGSR